jgi:hypothetical protein
VNKQDYIDRLKLTIEHLHNCSAVHCDTFYVEESFRGKTIWSGNVEAFKLTGHPKAECCYGWSYGEPEEFITVLKLPPVTDVHSAVKAGVAYQIKKARKE